MDWHAELPQAVTFRVGRNAMGPPPVRIGCDEPKFLYWWSNHAALMSASNVPNRPRGSEGIVNLLGLRLVSDAQAVYSDSICPLGSPLRTRYLGPTLESFSHLSAVIGRGQQMPSRSEVLGNGAVCGQKALRMPR